MPPRLKIPSSGPPLGRRRPEFALCRRCQYATVAAITPSPSISQMTSSPPPISYPPTQPPSHRRPEYRRSQLIRQYVSLLKTTPLILLFQHNNLRATEWVHIRRELGNALRRVDEALAAQDPDSTPLAPSIKLQIAQTNMFEPALRIAEYYHPEDPTSPEDTTTTTTDSSSPTFRHALSRNAYSAVNDPQTHRQRQLQHQHQHPLTPLLIGPLALLTLPTVSPQHVKAALQILSPSPPSFPAPTRRANPTFHESGVPDSVRKLLLLGARVEGGRIFDLEGTRWMGGIEGGIDGLRARIVQMLQGAGGAGLVRVLEAASTSLYFTLEGRRGMLEEEEEEEEEEDGEGGDVTEREQQGAGAAKSE